MICPNCYADVTPIPTGYVDDETGADEKCPICGAVNPRDLWRFMTDDAASDEYDEYED